MKIGNQDGVQQENCTHRIQRLFSDPVEKRVLFAALDSFRSVYLHDDWENIKSSSYHSLFQQTLVAFQWEQDNAFLRRDFTLKFILLCRI